jgi:hypothetical protein
MVFCNQCKYFKLSECEHPNNMKTYRTYEKEWVGPDVRAAVINANNDCQWFEQASIAHKIWYAASWY